MRALRRTKGTGRLKPTPSERQTAAGGMIPFDFAQGGTGPSAGAGTEARRRAVGPRRSPAVAKAMAGRRRDTTRLVLKPLPVQ